MLEVGAAIAELEAGASKLANRHSGRVIRHMDLRLDEQDALLLDRLLTIEYDALEAQGRNLRSDPDLARVGSLMRAIGEWLVDKDRP